MSGPGAAEADRAEAMARRLGRTIRWLRAPPEGQILLDQAFRVAMEPRRERGLDDHHPDYLHPARNALILMDDLRVGDPEILAAAALLETRDRSLEVDDDIVTGIHPAVAAHRARIPRPDLEGDRLLETLLALPRMLVVAAAAERLDHARHLHLRNRTEWMPYYELTREVYAPVAVRVDQTLGARLVRWCDTFRRRFLER